MTDAELIEATRRGERAAFGLLVERYQRMVEAVAFSVTGRRAVVDDVVQDTFVAAWRTIDRLRDSARVRAWLYGIARNLALKARRRRREEPLGDVVSPRTPFDDVCELEREREVTVALARLPARYREPLVLFYYEHCTVKEVADALAVREDAVMQQLSRGRRRLGEALATKLEIALESKPSRAALTVCVLALLPTRAASAASVAITSAAANAGTTATAIRVAWWRPVISWLAEHWRIPGAALATAGAIVLLVFATEQSNAVTARVDAQRTEHHDQSHHATTAPPHLPEAKHRIDIHKNIMVASPDPAETCARSARALVTSVLGRDAFRTINGKTYFEPSPELMRTADETAERAAATCGGDRWPELYVICEGTEADISDGTVTCYPYDPFAQG